MGAGDRALARVTLGLPLLRAGRALRELPLVTEEVFEEIVAPLGRRRGPGDLESARDGIDAHAGVEAALPAKALRFELAGLGIAAHVRRRSGAVRLAEGVAASD